MGTKLTGIHIKNFRNIGRLDLDLTDPDGKPLNTVVLCGEDGKTSVLEAIILALGLDNLLPTSRYDIKSMIQWGKKEAEIEVDLVDDNNMSSRKKYLRRDSSAISEPILYQPPFVLYFGSDRDSKPGLEHSIEQEPFYLPHVEEVLTKVWYDFYEHGTSKGRFSLNYVNQAAGMIHFKLILHKSNDMIIPVCELSSSEVDVLTILGTLVLCSPKPAIVLIDEPELHKHIQLHRHLMYAIRKIVPESQIIVATQSFTDIVSMVMSYERFCLLHEGDNRINTDKKGCIYKGGN